MRTLYLRNVPDDVAERLERMAKRDAMSVNAVAVRELDAASRTIDNAALLAALPDLDVSREAIVQGLDEARAER